MKSSNQVKMFFKFYHLKIAFRRLCLGSMLCCMKHESMVRTWSGLVLLSICALLTVTFIPVRNSSVLCLLLSKITLLAGLGYKRMLGRVLGQLSPRTWHVGGPSGHRRSTALSPVHLGGSLGWSRVESHEKRDYLLPAPSSWVSFPVS